MLKKILPKQHHFLHFSQRFFWLAFLSWVGYLFALKVVRHRSLKKHHNRKLDRPVIVVANHVSAWDPFLILAAMNRRFFFRQLLWRLPAYHGHFKLPHHRALYEFLGVYPIGGKGGSLEEKLGTTLELLKKGHNSVFFPQGKRVRVGHQEGAKPGIGYILSQVEAYVLPVYIDYTRRGKDGHGARIGRAGVVFGGLIKSEHFVEKYPREERAEAVMKKVNALGEVLNERLTAEQEQELLARLGNLG
jgi:1-acyl-sn-glycerol-3-phosphate acyltransferase